MKKQKLPDIMGTRHHLFFENFAPNPIGQVIHSGMTSPMRRNNWWNTGELHSFPYYGLVMIGKGGSGFYRNETGFKCQLRYGNFILVLPHFKQLYGPGKDDEWSDISVGFAGPLFDLHQKNHLFHPSRLVWEVADPAGWISRLTQRLEAARPVSEIGIARETASFLALLLELLESAQLVQENAAASDWFHRACLLLTCDLSRNVDLNAVAGEMGMSYNSFRHYFTRRAGMPPLHYRHQKRVEAACAFLQTTKKSCKEIAAYLGYSSEQHFSAHFKEWMKMPPREYRRQQDKSVSR